MKLNLRIINVGKCGAMLKLNPRLKIWNYKVNFVICIIKCNELKFN